jgi:hypothetical protein
MSDNKLQISISMDISKTLALCESVKITYWIIECIRPFAESIAINQTDLMKKKGTAIVSKKNCDAELAQV